MPKLPIPTAQGQNQVGLRQFGTLSLPTPRADSYGAGIGQGAAALGQALLDVDAKLQDQANKLEVIDLEGQFKETWDKNIQRIYQEPDVTKHRHLFDEIVTDTYHDIAGQATNNTVAVAFKTWADQYMQTERINVANHGRKVTAQRQIIGSQTAAEKLIDKAALLPYYEPRGDESFQEAMDLITALGPWHLDPKEVEALKETLTDRYWRQYAINHPHSMMEIAAAGGRPGAEHSGSAPLDKGKLEVYRGIAQQAIAGQWAEAERARKQAERQLKAEQQDTQNVFIEKLTQNTLTTGEVLRSNLDPVGVGSKEHYIQLLTAKATAAAKEPTFIHDPAVFADTLRKIRKGDITTEQDVEEVYMQSTRRGRGITWEDTVKLRTEVDDVRTPEGKRLGQTKSAFLDGIKAQIDKSNLLMGVLDQDGKQKFYEFSQYVDARVAEYRQQQKDPHPLFDPNSPDYLGQPGILVPFQKTMQESMKDITDKLRKHKTPTVEPRREGETIEQYLERTKKR